VQPTYLTLTSSGSSPWRQANWYGYSPQQLSFAVLSTGGSSWSIDMTFEDPTRTFPNPNSSSVTAFTLLAGSSNQYVAVGASIAPIAAWRFSLNSASTGGTLTLVANERGVG
jgi:hypothetical protein